MSASFVLTLQSLENAFGDVIAQDYEREYQKIQSEYDFKYRHRHQFGLNSTLDDLQLAEEENNKIRKLVKRRNWQWYLLKSKQFLKLDSVLGTSFCDSYVTSLNITYAERQEQKRRQQEKIKRSHSDSKLFSKQTWLYDSIDSNDYPSEKESETDLLIEECKRFFWYPKAKHERRRKLNYGNIRTDSDVSESILDDRDYDRLYKLSLKLRKVIETLEEARRKVVVKIRLALRSPTRDVEPGVEMTEFYKNSDVEETPPKYQNSPETAGGDTRAREVPAENVVLSETEIPQVDVSAPSPRPWSDFVSSDTKSNHDTLVNRWFRVGTYTWTTQHNVNTTLVALDLPKQAILVGNTCDQPNKIPFRIHRYWRGTMHIKVQVNANKFQVGQLQCAWFYQPKADNSFTDLRSDVYARSGAAHVIANASPSNEAELVVPFKMHKSMLHTKTKQGYGDPLDEGTLFVTVLNQLYTVSNTSPRADFTIFIKFSDNEFTGMISGDIDTPPSYQMMNALTPMVKIAENLLTSSNNDNNRDNPPSNQPPPMFVPTGSHSWCIGTDLSEPIHNLRLSGKAQTCHPDKEIDEMSIKHLSRKYQLLAQFKWSTQHRTGQRLWACPANPLPPKNILHVSKAQSENLLAAYQLVPVGFVSSLFQYWRGSLEFRFDIVASQYHAGKLMLAYIPGLDEDEEVTLEQARASPNITINLKDTLSYTWRIPYVADVPWWPRRYAGNSLLNNHTSPSKIFVFVNNELVLGSTVYPVIDINVYMRGGDDFEVAIPVQPAMGLGSDRRYLGTLEPFSVYPTNEQYYSGAWHQVPNAQVFRRATTSEAYEVFTSAVVDRPGYYTISSNQGLTAFDKNRNVQVPITHAIFLKSPSSYGGFVGLPIHSIPSDPSSVSRLTTIARTAFDNGYTVGSWITPLVMTTTAAGNSSSYGFFDNTWSTTGNPYGGSLTTPWAFQDVPEAEYEVVPRYQGNREDTFNMVDNTTGLSSTGGGMMMFGETFLDLKDYCRRYQMYATFNVPGASVETEVGKCNFTFPVNPAGLRLDLGTPQGINQVWNRARNGHIPLIASLYRYFRGSIRIRILVTNSSGLQAWYQHRPDRRLTVNGITPCQTLRTTEALINHGYGYYVQNLELNNIIELEIPFYQKANFGLLQSPNLSVEEFTHYFTLGEVAVGFFGNKAATENMQVTVYYSLADDCRFSTFQGVPPLVLLDDLPVNESDAKYQMMKWFTNPVNSLREQATTEVKSTIAKAVEGTSKDLFATIEGVANDIKGKVGCNFDKNLVLQAVSQFIHCTINPTFKTIGWAICSILLSCGLIVMETVQGFLDACTNIFNVFKNKFSISNEPREEVETEPTYQNKVEMSTDEAAATGLITCLMGCMCTVFGVKNARSGKVPKEWSASIFEGIEKGMRLSNVAFIFLRNIMSVLDSMRVWLCSKFIKGYNAVVAIDKHRDIISKWMKRSIDICTPNIAIDLKYDHGLLVEFYDLYTLGKTLYEYATHCESPNLRVSIHKTYDKLHRIAETLTDEGVDPHVRKQPYTIYMYGESNIGKSEIQTKICKELLVAENITTPTVMNCVISTASKYWDDCDRQPVLVIDDMFAVQTEELLSRQLETLFAVVSPVVLIPPKAELEQKGKPYSPSIFWINSNHEYYKHPQVISEAVWRRRDILIHAEKDDSYSKVGCYHCENKCAIHEVPSHELAKGILDDNHHLKFRYKTQCADPNVPYSNYLTYQDLIVYLKSHFKENRARENIRFRERIISNAAVSRSGTIGESLDLVAEWNAAIYQRREAERSATNYLSNLINHQLCSLKEWSTSLREYFVKQPYVPPIPGCVTCRSLRARCGECLHLQNAPMKPLAQPVSTLQFKENAVDPGDMFDNAIILARKEVAEKAAKEEEERKKKEDEELVDPAEAARVLQEAVSSSSSTSSSSIEVVETPPKYQNEASVSDSSQFRKQTVDEFFNKTRLLLPVEIIADIKNMCYILPEENFASFGHFLSSNIVELNRVFKSYSNSVLSLKLFKRVCEDISLTDSVTRTPCCHDPSYNDVILQNGNIIIACSDGHHRCSEIFSNLAHWAIKCGRCMLHFPWKQLELRAKSLTLYSDHIEPWMEALLHVPFMHDKWYKTMWSDFASCTSDFLKKTLPSIGYKVWNFITSMKGMLCVVGALFIGSMLMQPPGELHYETHIHRYQSKYEPAACKVAKHPIARPEIAPKFQSTSQQSRELPRFLEENMVSIHADFEDERGITRTSVSSCFVICDRRMLILRHYWDHWIKLPPTTKFYLVSRKTVSVNYPKGIPLTLGNLQPEWFADIDSSGFYKSHFGIAQLPQSSPAFKDLRKFIATVEDHRYIDTQACYLYDSQKRCQVILPIQLQKGYIVSDGDNGTHLPIAYKYRYTGDGKCGSILVCGNLQRPIIGMHFAGSNIWGSSEPIYSENFKRSVEKERAHYEFDTFFHDMDLDVSNTLEFKTLLYPQGVVPKEVAHHQGGKTQYRPSLLYGICPVTSEPNPLSPSDRRLPKGSHPLRDGVEHMGKPPREFEMNLLLPAKDDLTDVILANVIPVRPNIDVLSFSDAVVGNSRIHGFEPLEWSTSEGFPLSSMRPAGCKGKKWLFKLSEGPEGYIFEGFHPELKRILDLEYSLRKRNVRVPTVFTDCLKDALIDVEKCLIPGKTRVFSISPVQFTIAFKMYFGDFLASYRRARLSAEHGIGIDVNSREWSELAYKLQSKGQGIVAGDYKNFGPGLMLLAVRFAFDIILKWYEVHDTSERREENNRIRKILLSEILYSRHLVNDLIYEPSSGIPSGSPITAELNSLVNSLYLRCAWLSIVGESLKIMRENVCIITYGDDVCMNVSDKYVTDFNTETISNFFAQYDIVFTDVDKSNNIIKCRNLSNVTFLKRGFTPHPYLDNIYLAPIDKNSIYKCVNWIRSKGDPLDATLENCVQACELAFGLGPAEYNRLKEVLITECGSQLRKELVVESWDAVSKRCFSS
uniref:Genome polyprotein n=1 Tax=Rondonia iflavirus 1 TaxID=2697644 RepID=A0A6B9SAG8_9VIRU|nr:polyprotein [Rondonia iflavirus 1]